MTFCPHCGLLLPAGSRVCPRCGTPAPAPALSSAPLSRGLVYDRAGKETSEPLPPGAESWGVVYEDASVPQVTTAEYFLMLTVFLIPFVGLIPMLYWSLSERTAPERRHLARAYLLRTLLVAALVLVAAVIFAVLMQISYNTMLYRYFY